MTVNPEILPPERLPGSALLVQDGTGLRVVDMMAPLPVDDPLHETSKATIQFRGASKSKATQKAYLSDWNDFDAWCLRNGRVSLPAEVDTVSHYLSSLAKGEPGCKPRKPSTITRRLTAISAFHKMNGFESPAALKHVAVADTLHGIRNELGSSQTMKKPLTLEKIVRILGVLDGPIVAARDKALILLGFAGGLRRAELAAIKVEHIQRHKKGITILIPRSKTDQEGKGRQIDILYGIHDATCPILALDNWLAIAGIRAGYVMRRVGMNGKMSTSLNKDSIGRIVKRLVRRAKIDDPDDYSGHSLRAGFVTEASANGATDRQIMKQTGHKSLSMVHRYSRADQQDRLIAGSKLGL